MTALIALLDVLGRQACSVRVALAEGDVPLARALLDEHAQVIAMLRVGFAQCSQRALVEQKVAELAAAIDELDAHRAGAAE